MTRLRTRSLSALIEQLTRGAGTPITFGAIEAHLEAQAISADNLHIALASPRLRILRPPGESAAVTLANPPEPEIAEAA